MTNSTQLQWVVKQLTENGKVSRNEALRNFISRLAAHIGDLKDVGWDIKTTRERTLNGYGRGLDTIYKLVSRP